MSDFYPHQFFCVLQEEQIKLYSESPCIWTLPAKKTCWQSGIPDVTSTNTLPFTVKALKWKQMLLYYSIYRRNLNYYTSTTYDPTFKAEHTLQL